MPDALQSARRHGSRLSENWHPKRGRRGLASRGRERVGMSRIAYVNGRYLPGAAAAVSIDDRAFTFGDGVYEVCEVRAGALIDETGHLARLGRSLAALRISWPIVEAALRADIRETVLRNRVRDGLVYLQVSRGAAQRDHGFP